MGCTLNCDPSWLSVFSPRIASVATRALNCGLYCFLVVVIELSLSMTPPNFSLLPGLKSWDHYSQLPTARHRGRPLWEGPGCREALEFDFPDLTGSTCRKRLT